MTTTDRQDEQKLEEQTFVSHLLELRDRLLRMMVVVLVLFLAMFPFANDLYSILAGPLIRHLPEGTSMIATRVIAPFLTPLKLTFVMAIILAIPFILYQFWAFVAPGLYRHERRLALPLVSSSVALFYLGMAFAYFVVFPLLFDILPSMAPDQITVSPDITDYLDFVLTLFFAFGIAFEVPIATILLVWMGMTTPQALREKRPYIIVGAFCVGMLLTPPDVISQTLLALPMCILFELGVIFSQAFVRDQGRDQDQDQAAAAASAAEGAGSAAPRPEPAATAAPAGETAVDDESEQMVRAPRRPNREFVPLTEAELKAQLDRIEVQEAEEGDGQDKLAQTESVIDESDPAAPEARRAAVHAKLEQVGGYREREDEDNARRLLYEVLAEGDEEQVRVARNILNQLDEQF